MYTPGLEKGLEQLRMAMLFLGIALVIMVALAYIQHLALIEDNEATELQDESSWSGAQKCGPDDKTRPINTSQSRLLAMSNESDEAYKDLTDDLNHALEERDGLRKFIDELLVKVGKRHAGYFPPHWFGDPFSPITERNNLEGYSYAGYYFWDETEAYVVGPYRTFEEAWKAQKAYRP